MKKFAVFDIDGTLYRGNLTWDFFNALIQARLIPVSSMRELEQLYVAHDSRISDNAYSNYDKSLIDMFCDSLKSIDNLEEYRTIGHQVAEDSKNRLYRFTRDFLVKLKSQNRYLIAITNSVGAVAKPFAEALGFDEVIANNEIIDKSGRGIIDWTIYEAGRSKATLLQKSIKQNNLTTKDSYAFGDTMSDASMMYIVENPILFNPEKRLQQLSVIEGWTIVVERKNVIYELKQGKTTPKLNIT
jgi:HAD superfamily hydrolase (TIGR01490 family)